RQAGYLQSPGHRRALSHARTPGGARHPACHECDPAGKPYGVLEVDSRSEGEFAQSDIVFLQGVANILGMAIERQRMEGNLRQALDRQQLLIKEVNHRVNNSLSIVASMLHLHASGAESRDVRHELREASGRIAAIARAHQRLYRSD